MLDPTVRASQSIWELIEPGAEERIVARLAADLESGKWDEEHGALREQESYEGSLRLSSPSRLERSGPAGPRRPGWRRCRRSG